MEIIKFFTNSYDEIFAVLAALILVAEIITNITPSEKDNSVVLKLKRLIDFFAPNKAKTDLPGDFTHEVKTDLKLIRRRRKNRQNTAD